MSINPNDPLNRNTLVRVLAAIILGCVTAWAGWVTNNTHQNAIAIAAYAQELKEIQRRLDSIETKLDKIDDTISFYFNAPASPQRKR